MNEKQRTIIEFLAAAIRNKKIDTTKEYAIDWNQIYEEAKAQGIQTIIYPVIKDLYTQNCIGAEIMLKWRKAALSLSMYQLQLMNEVKQLLLRFSEEGIAAIALKGIVLRELYPQPDLRIMGDADILVHKQDVERAKAILLERNFIEGGKNPEHIEFINSSKIEIELHWNLIGKGRFKNDVRLEKTVWDNAVKTSVFDVPVLKLNDEDNLLYIGMHMAKHMVNSGFGLRQLCDFALLYESVKRQVDWNKFYQVLERYGVNRFFTLLFLVCQHFFSIELPDCRALKIKNGTKYSHLMIEEMFEGGLYGYKDFLRVKASFIQAEVKTKKAKTAKDRLAYIKRLFFPSPGQLSSKYTYVEKHSVLLPLAWIHRILNIIFSRDFSLKQKLLFFNHYGNRSELLWWLDMR